MLPVLVFSLVVCACVCQPPAPSDHCKVIIDGHAHQTEVHVQPSCLNGTVWWEYPQGQVKVHFRISGATSSPYKVCIEDAHGLVSRAEVLTMTDVSSGLPVILNTGGPEVCTAPHTGETTLQFSGPSHSDHYIAFIDYQIKM